LAFGGSAGGIAPLIEILTRLPADFSIPIVVVQHLGADARGLSRFPEVLGWRSHLHCKWAENGESPRAGYVYVAPPGSNLILTPALTFFRSFGPRPALGWPSVDVFFCSMSLRLGPAAIAVILSGALYDGAAGIAVVRRRGGATMVQHPALAEYPEMPTAAAEIGKADLKLSPSGIVDAVQFLATCGVDTGAELHNAL
jgi:two-component system chemotaxis response regulator CheB